MFRDELEREGVCNIEKNTSTRIPDMVQEPGYIPFNIFYKLLSTLYYAF